MYTKTLMNNIFGVENPRQTPQRGASFYRGVGLLNFKSYIIKIVCLVKYVLLVPKIPTTDVFEEGYLPLLTDDSKGAPPPFWRWNPP